MHGRTIRRHPIIALLPIFMTGVMIGLGVWGVLAGSQLYSKDKQNQAQVRSVRRAKAEREVYGGELRKWEGSSASLQARHTALYVGAKTKAGGSADVDILSACIAKCRRFHDI